MPDRMPEDMPDRMPDRMPEDMSDRMPEDLPVTKCINVMVGITRSKVFFLTTKWWWDNWLTFFWNGNGKTMAQAHGHVLTCARERHELSCHVPWNAHTHTHILIIISCNVWWKLGIVGFLDWYDSWSWGMPVCHSCCEWAVSTENMAKIGSRDNLQVNPKISWQKQCSSKFPLKP